jgi:hypothetical protein
LTRLLPLATTGRPDTGVFTAVTTGEGKYLDWLGGRQGVVPPFRGVFGGAVRDSRARVLLEAAGTAEPLLILGRTGRGQVAFLTAFPLWRWGFGPEFQPGQTPLDELLVGLVRCLSDSDTVRFRLTSDKPGYLAGEQIRLRLTAERSDRTAWPGLSVWLRTDRQRQPMTETRAGIYEVVVRPAAGDWAVEAEVRADDSVVGSASTSFAVSAQSIELARTGLNSALLRRIAQVSGGRYHSADSLPRDASGVRLGTYRRGLVLDPRRTVWCYAAVALLAGVELALRRRKGLL